MKTDWAQRYLCPMSNQSPLPEKQTGLHQLYSEDPQHADEIVWGRKANPFSRRGFFERPGLASMTAAVGSEIVFADKMPSGLIPAALAQSTEPFQIPGKEGLSVMNDRPLVAETPAHLLDDAITPAKHLFIRNNGLAPAPVTLNSDKWTLEIAGESCE